MAVDCCLFIVVFGCVQSLMNRREKYKGAYVPTTSEHIANVTTHGFAVFPSCYGLRQLVHLAESKKEVNVAFTYGVGISCLFLTSTIYHIVFFLGKYETLRFYMHLLDRSTIYLFIATSYTPWLTLRETGLIGIHLRWMVWIMALMGISYQIIFHEKYKMLETCLYLLVSSLPGLFLLFISDEKSGLPMLAAGGVVFLVGVAFFKSDGIIPCAHAIWHLHVMTGAAFQYFAVKIYLMSREPQNRFSMESEHEEL